MQLLILFSQLKDFALLALRVALGAVFIVHGFGKRATWKAQPSAQMPARMLTIFRMLSVLEPLGGAAAIVGLLTVPAALGMAAAMVGAIRFKLMVWKVPFMAYDKTGWEFDMVTLAGAVILVFFGGGAFSADRLLLGW